MSEQIVVRMIPMARWIDSQGHVVTDWHKIGDLPDPVGIDVGWSVLRACFVDGVIRPKTIKCVRIVEEMCDGH